MKNLALLFVALMGTTVLATAAPLQAKTTPTAPTTKEAASTKPAKHNKKHNKKEAAKPETAKPAATK